MAESANWVLVTGDGQSRGAVAAVRALAAAGYCPAVTVSDGVSMAGASRYCLRRVPVPDATADPLGYAHAVRKELDRRPYLAVLPATDAVMIALKLPEVHLMDKVAWASLAAASGVAVLPARVFETSAELHRAAPELDYPVVVKPDLKRFMAQFVASPADLKRVPEDSGRLLVQPYCPDPMRGIIGLMWAGRLVAAVHFSYIRIWPMPCGAASAAETIPPDNLIEAGLERLLAGYQGMFHVDLVGPYLLDINPRIHPTLALARAAGVDLVGLYCGLLQGATPSVVRGRSGVFFRWVEGDLRSIVAAVVAGRMSPRAAIRALSPRRGEAHAAESLSDPWPFIERVRYIPRAIGRRRARRRAMVAPRAGPRMRSG